MKNKSFILVNAALLNISLIGNVYAEEANAAEAVSNPYGLSAIINQGDIIAKIVLVMLLIMSLGTWIILIYKYLEQSKLFSNAKKVRHEFWEKPNLEEAVGGMDQDSAFCYIAQNAIKAKNEHHSELASKVALNTWIEMSFNRSIEEIQSKLSIGLAFLATVGSTAPFIRDGKLIGIAVSGNQRNPLFQQVPTFAQAGFPNYKMMYWFGVLASNIWSDLIKKSDIKANLN